MRQWKTRFLLILHLTQSVCKKMILHSKLLQQAILDLFISTSAKGIQVVGGRNSEMETRSVFQNKAFCIRNEESKD